MHTEVVIGLDPHKDVLVAVVVDGNGRQLDVKDATAGPRGHRALLAWARKIGPHRWAVEDVRHVAGGLVRFLLALLRSTEVKAITPTPAVQPVAA